MAISNGVGLFSIKYLELNSAQPMVCADTFSFKKKKQKRNAKGSFFFIDFGYSSDHR